MKKLIGVFVIALTFAASASGQKYSVSTNMAGYLNLLTINAEGSFAVHQHWSLMVGVKYNPFSFGKSETPITNKQQSYYVGTRFWPWHTYSGWWIAAKLQYQEYNSGGIVSKKAEEGDRWGAGLTGGYTYMLNRRLNLEFGLGFWGGVKKYSGYSCTKCGTTLKTGTKAFIMPNDIIIGITYVF